MPLSIMPLKDDIIFVAMENWDEVWRRNQPIAAEFARRVPSRKMLYMGLPIDVSHGLRRLNLRPLWRALWRSRELPQVPGLENICLFNPVKWLPNSLPFCQALNRWMERRQLRRAAGKAGLREPILWLNPHYALHMLGRLGESLVVYDIGDDWTQTRQARWLKRQTMAEDAELCRRADVLVVVSERLRKLKARYAPRIHVVPNGVYAERYAGVCDGSMPPHPAFERWPRPVLAYTGTIHAERVDLPMVEAIAEAYPKATVALIGPNLLEPEDDRRLRAHANIRMPGPFPFEEMPRVMSAFDVCIVPHVVSAFTESLDPLKFYEYLASGLPVAATPVPGFREHPQWIHLGEGNAGMIAAISKALHEPRERRTLRQAAAKRHGWSVRVDAIETAIEEAKCQRRLCLEPL